MSARIINSYHGVPGALQLLTTDTAERLSGNAVRMSGESNVSPSTQVDFQAVGIDAIQVDWRGRPLGIAGICQSGHYLEFSAGADSRRGLARLSTVTGGGQALNLAGGSTGTIGCNQQRGGGGAING